MNGDIQTLQGTWRIASLEMDGQTLADDCIAESRVIIRGDRVTSLGMGATYEGSLQLDEAKTPKQFDLRFTEGVEKGNTSLGIYELNGDTWRMCLAVTARDRPASFTAGPGGGVALQTFRRDPRDQADSGPVACV